MARALEQVEAGEGAKAAPALPRLRDGLRAAFGRRAPGDRPAMEVLVLGLAGARATGGERAAEALKRGFRPWNRLFDAAPELVAAALRPVEPDLGRALKRAEGLIATVRRLAARSGGLSLDFLAQMKPQEAWAWLEDALGLQPPLICAVLCAAPIRHRVAYPSVPAMWAMTRLGVCGPDGRGPAAGGRTLAEAAPAGWTGADLLELSELLQALGESLCHQEKPECPACPVAALCPASTVAAAPAVAGGLAGKPIAYLRRRIARMEGGGRAAPQAGLKLGGAAFAEDVFPHGLSCGAHQATGATALQGAAPLILAVAAAAAHARREREGRLGQGRAREGPGEGVGGLLKRKARSAPRDTPSATVRLLMVQEADAVLEHGEPYPPGLQALGIDPAVTAFVTVGSGGEVLRVVEEALKLRAAPILVAELRKGEGVADLAVTRRLNLAARRAGALLFLVTPDLANTSAALTRWRVGAAPSRPPRPALAASSAGRLRLGPPAFTLDLVRNRLGSIGAWTVEWDLHEQRFRNPQPRFGLAQPAVPAPHLPPPVDRPAVAFPGRAA